MNIMNNNLLIQPANAYTAFGMLCDVRSGVAIIVSLQKRMRI